MLLNSLEIAWGVVATVQRKGGGKGGQTKGKPSDYFKAPITLSNL